MMKLKYSICCDLDVPKKVIFATIVTTNKEGISEYNQKSFLPSTLGFYDPLIKCAQNSTLFFTLISSISLVFKKNVYNKNISI